MATSVMFPVSSWGDFGLLLSSRLRRRTLTLRCADCQPHGRPMDVCLVLPNRDQLALRGEVVDSVRQHSSDPACWLTRLALSGVADSELARWESLAATRPRQPTANPAVAPAAAPARQNTSRVARVTTLDSQVFADVPVAIEPPPLLSLEDQLEREVALAARASERGDHAGAAAALERALVLCPGTPLIDARLHVARARQAAELGQTELVESLVNHARALVPGVLRNDDPLLVSLRSARKRPSLFAFLRRHRDE